MKNNLNISNQVRLSNTFWLWSILILIGMAILITGLIRFIPHGIGLYYQIIGGYTLEKALISTSPVKRDISPCFTGKLSDEKSLSIVYQAITLLDKAIAYNPSLSHAYLLKGRAYCLLGQAGQSLEAFQTFSNLRPKNPLGYLEYLFAYTESCIISRDGVSEIISTSTLYNYCNHDEKKNSILNALDNAGVHLEPMLTNADNAFEAKNYPEAYKWYSTAFFNIRNLKEPKLLSSEFKWSVSAALAGFPLPQQFRDLLPVYDLKDLFVIQAEDMRWLNSLPEWGIDFGTRVASYPRDDDRISIINWNGRIIAFVQILEDGIYLVTVRAQDMPPASTLIQIEDNLRPLGQIELTRGDKSLQEFSFPATLKAGLHLISVNYLNNGIVQGIDRDAFVDWIRLQKMSE